MKRLFSLVLFGGFITVSTIRATSDLPQKFTNSIGIDFVLIEAGTF